MNKLIWELFLMLREVMPASADNTKRQSAWAARFQRETGYEDMTEPVDVAHDEAAHPQLPLRDEPQEEAHEPEDEPEPAPEETSANPHARRPVARPKAPAHRKK